jgi:hypothetical protein
MQIWWASAYHFKMLTGRKYLGSEIHVEYTSAAPPIHPAFENCFIWNYECLLIFHREYNQVNCHSKQTPRFDRL